MQILKKLILLIIFINYSFFVFSQKYGVMCGGNYSRFIGKETPQFIQPIYRYNGGFFAEFNYSTYTTVLIELKYDLKGTKMSDSIKHFLKGYYTITEKVDYITLPILYKLKLADNDFEIYFSIGASLSYLIHKNRKMRAFDENLELNADYLFPFKNKPLQVDFVMAWGLGFKKFSLELKYSNGITTQYNDKAPLLIRNNSISLNTYFTIFKIKPKRKLW